ncbi:MAG: hypothetical protein PQJ44_09515 [Sphaerochaetaceae bacterium]|nr:hypothetical protein [Sphaerochaetaceae bacterium]
MSKKSPYTLKQLLATFNHHQLFKINSRNIPLFFGTVFEFEKIQDFEYKGLPLINVKLLSIKSENDINYINITLDLYIDFNKYKASPLNS